MPEREYNCEACRDTGHKVLDNGSLSDFLDCVNCNIATERAQLNKFVAAINGQPLEDIAWQLVRTTQRTERSIAAAQKAGLKEQLRVAQAALSQDSATPQDNVPGVSELPPLPTPCNATFYPNGVTYLAKKLPVGSYFTGPQMIEYAKEYGEACVSAALRAYGQRAVVSVPEELHKIGELLRAQDNRITDQPLFIVQQKRINIGFDTDYSQGDEDIVWWIEDCTYFKGDAKFEEMERAYEETGDIPDDWHRHGFTTDWEFVTACFTEQGCKDYLAKDGRNLKEPRIYADGSYRNNEYRAVRNWLMSLPATAAPPQPNDGQRAAVVVPKGYRLVPLEPTHEMLNAAQKKWHYSQSWETASDCYRALVAAAPSQPQQEAVPAEPSEQDKLLKLLVSQHASSIRRMFCDGRPVGAELIAAIIPQMEGNNHE